MATSAATASLLALGLACLPDLGAIPPLPDVLSPAPLACGDGLIDKLEDGGLETCDPGTTADAGAALGCEGCQVTCGGTIAEASAHCYFTAGESATFGAAQEACARAGAHVVTVASSDEATFVDGIAQSAYWVGLERLESRGGYATPLALGEPGFPAAGGAPCPGCFAPSGSVLDGGELASIDADAGSAACLVAIDRTWRKAPCAASFRILCEREPVGRRAQSCGGLLCTTVTATASAKRYVIVLSPETAIDAKRFCEGYQGGGLVRLDSAAEREELAREIAALSPDPLELWIGLASPLDGGPYVWDDDAGEGSRPRVWGSGQPSARARRAFLRFGQAFDTRLAFVSDGGPNGETPDAERRAFVCQRPLE